MHGWDLNLLLGVVCSVGYLVHQHRPMLVKPTQAYRAHQYHMVLMRPIPLLDVHGSSSDPYLVDRERNKNTKKETIKNSLLYKNFL